MNKSLILQRIQEYYDFTKDSKFDNFSGISLQNLSNWKSRKTFDYEIIHTKCLDINIDWIFDMLKVVIF